MVHRNQNRRPKPAVRVPRTPTEVDVLFSRGPRIRNHNKEFRVECLSRHLAYVAAQTTEENRQLRDGMLQWVRDRGGRFLNGDGIEDIADPIAVYKNFAQTHQNE